MLNERFYSNMKKYDIQRSIQKHPELTQTDIDLILRWVSETQARTHITEIRARKLAITLIGWRRFLPVPYDQLTITDVYTGVLAMKNGVSNGRQNYGNPLKQNTQRDFIKILRRFLIWLNDENVISLPEKKIREIKTPAAVAQVVTPDMLLTVEEVLSIVRAAYSTRDKAFIMVLYESGVRIGELARLTWRDVIFDKYGVRLYITDTKTSKYRYSRLTMSTEYLSRLKNEHVNPTDDAFVFVNRNGEPMTWIGCKKIITRASTRAGISKHVHAHLFRHSRITHMIQQNYQESIIKESMWGNTTTNMFRTYVSLSEEAIDNEYLRRAGIKSNI